MEKQPTLWGRVSLNLQAYEFFDFAFKVALLPLVAIEFFFIAPFFRNGLGLGYFGLRGIVEFASTINRLFMMSLPFYVPVQQFVYAHPYTPIIAYYSLSAIVSFYLLVNLSHLPRKRIIHSYLAIGFQLFLACGCLYQTINISFSEECQRHYNGRWVFSDVAVEQCDAERRAGDTVMWVHWPLVLVVIFYSIMSHVVQKPPKLVNDGCKNE